MLLRRLVFISIFLALIVVLLGAYTRLTHAGLGCPDWPGCYGLIDVPDTYEKISRAQEAFPDHPIEPTKAWNEMIHRYFAGILGLLILLITIISIKNNNKGGPLFLPIIILLVVIFQAALGMWTVTLKLMPIVVMGHLLGGFTTLSLLFLLYLRLKKIRVNEPSYIKKYRTAAYIGIVILLLQIALGGWTSSNYAALVCAELPICQAGWTEQLTFVDAFDLIPPEKESYEFGHLDHSERLTIHVMHRFGAIVTTLYLAWLALMVFIHAHSDFFRRSAIIVAVMLIAQVSLGVSNIIFSLPLAVAVSHNIVAALLLLSLISLTYHLQRKT